MQNWLLKCQKIHFTKYFSCENNSAEKPIIISFAVVNKIGHILCFLKGLFCVGRFLYFPFFSAAWLSCCICVAASPPYFSPPPHKNKIASSTLPQHGGFQPVTDCHFQQSEEGAHRSSVWVQELFWGLTGVGGLGRTCVCFPSLQ